MTLLDAAEDAQQIYVCKAANAFENVSGNIFSKRFIIIKKKISKAVVALRKRSNFTHE